MKDEAERRFADKDKHQGLQREKPPLMISALFTAGVRNEIPLTCALFCLILRNTEPGKAGYSVKRKTVGLSVALKHRSHLIRSRWIFNQASVWGTISHCFPPSVPAPKHYITPAVPEFTSSAQSLSSQSRSWVMFSDRWSVIKHASFI